MVNLTFLHFFTLLFAPPKRHALLNVALKLTLCFKNNLNLTTLHRLFPTNNDKSRQIATNSDKWRQMATNPDKSRRYLQTNQALVQKINPKQLDQKTKQSTIFTCTLC
jgi:hypothetical protein